VERAEAEAVYDQGREAVVAVLVALSVRIAVQDAQIVAQGAQIERLTARLEELERQVTGRRGTRRCAESGSAGRAGA